MLFLGKDRSIFSHNYFGRSVFSCRIDLVCLIERVTEFISQRYVEITFVYLVTDFACTPGAFTPLEP